MSDPPAKPRIKISKPLFLVVNPYCMQNFPEICQHSVQAHYESGRIKEIMMPGDLIYKFGADEGIHRVQTEKWSHFMRYKDIYNKN
jgi:hypothetical protein